MLEFLKSRRDIIFRGSSDKAIELLLQTADSLKTESQKLREQNWQLQMQHTSDQQALEQKTSRIKESKNILKKYENIIRDLNIDNERLRINSRTTGSNFIDTIASKLAELSKEKLAYELGGRDAANYVVKFIEV